MRITCVTAQGVRKTFHLTRKNAYLRDSISSLRHLLG
jgi:hypothetical protein